MVTWTEPSLREVSYRAAWSQMRSDRRRQQEAANKREHRREMWCEVAAGALAIATVVALVGIRLWVMG
jgi:Flp pilus assembly protein TadB